MLLGDILEQIFEAFHPDGFQHGVPFLGTVGNIGHMNAFSTVFQLDFCLS